MRKQKSKSSVNKTLRLKKLGSDLDYWIPQLRLGSWNISAELLPWEKGCGFGENAMDPNYDTSHIRIYDPDTIPEDVKGIRDLEVTLVHELLHIRLVHVASLSKKRKKKWPVEMAIETIAQSLVANRRGINIKDLR